MIAAALRQALSDRARNGRVHVVTSIVESVTPSTKAALNLVNKVAEQRGVLVVLERNDEAGVLSLRNLPEAHTIYVDQLNAYDVLVSDDVIFTQAALDTFTGAHSKEETK